ncbi:geranylgeranyl reductase family protein [Methanomicrobium sp. W14]|uniref:NAD(P)/FAD-dependent oxidoreductase n=1 Tax=Methanomicrobium sp. W14 TaxID=2817839 RepID=UPI001AE14E42|nr:NAD(P)/FAD-dependent oxidoreductase [Methanomicrobium sp. W14]MBP2132131.1 geranylgeranyl reductase family protein [Methanomicrobium sp. W14]
MYDVVVAGGGPVGSSAARFCSEKGLKTLLIEEHAGFGRPVQCAGLLSRKAFLECGVSERSVLNEVSGARIVSGLKTDLFFDAKKTMAYVVDRSALDLEMAQNAAKAGADVLLKTSVTGFRDGFVLTTGINGKKSVRCRMVIAADGPRSVFTRFLGMKRAPVFLSGIQAEIFADKPPNIVELHPYASPDFFGWVIPSNDKAARIGLCGERDVYKRFLRFFGRFEGSNIHLVTGTIPIGVMPKTYGNRVLFCGDAGGFAKPTSGGGVYTGIRTAVHASDTALKCCERDNFSDSSLSGYERSWKKDIGRELAFGMTLFKMRKKISDKTVENLCSCMNNPEIIDEIVKYGDMDRPREVIKRMVLKPSVMKAFGGVAKAELCDLLIGSTVLKKRM